MLLFQNKSYELFFSNQLAPLIALNYADEMFFSAFEQLAGRRYRVLSIIKQGWQQKYGLSEDISLLKETFKTKITDDSWASTILASYELKSAALRELLQTIANKDYSLVEHFVLIEDLKKVRINSAPLDAMSNMLHLFSSLVGSEFFKNLQQYTIDKNILNQNFIFYTQPIKESNYAKIMLPKLADQIELNHYDHNFSQILRIGAYIKDDVRTLLDLRADLMNNLFTELGKRIGCSAEDLTYLQIKELENYLLQQQNPNILIRERKTLTVLFYSDHHLRVYEGIKAEHFLKKGNSHEIVEKNANTEFHGETASLGKAQGKALVVQNSKEALEKIQHGDILVAPYTAVEYLPAMKKAAAIITETGGITSHAAIVSREFKIPCIIAVKNITKLLKTGQYIEVNADDGTVKIIDT